MAKKKETAEAVGTQVINVAGKELAKELRGPKKITERQQAIKAIVDEAVAKSQNIELVVSRGNMFGSPKRYIGNMGPISPEMLEMSGLPKLIQGYSGGGSYAIEIKSPGMESVVVELEIEGEPEVPIDKRGIKTAGSPMPTTPAGVPTNGAQTQYWANMLGIQTPYQQMQEQRQQSENMMAVVLAALVGKRGGGSEESEVVRQLKEQNAALERRFENQERSKEIEALKSELQRDREAADRKFEVLLNKITDTQPKTNPNAEMIMAVMPAITALIGDKNASVEAQGKIFEVMGNWQQASASERQAFIQMLQSQPKYEDRFLKMTEGMGNIMGTSTQAIGSMLSLMASMSPQPKGPGWEFLDKIAEQLPQVAEMMFDSDGEDGGEGPHQIEGGQVEVLEPGQSQQVSQMSGVEARQRLLAQAQTTAQEQAAKVPPREAFDDALKKIFDLAESEGDVHEIAFRVFKHAQAGFVVADAWWNNPNDASVLLFHTMRSRGQIGITDERIIEIATAIREFHEFLAAGDNPMARAEEYRTMHGIKIAMPKPKVPSSQPQSSVSVDGKNQDTFGEGHEGETPVKIKPPEAPTQTQPSSPSDPKNWVKSVVTSEPADGESRPASEWTKDAVGESEEEEEEPEAPMTVTIVDED